MSDTALESKSMKKVDTPTTSTASSSSSSQLPASETKIDASAMKQIQDNLQESMQSLFSQFSRQFRQDVHDINQSFTAPSVVPYSVSPPTEIAGGKTVLKSAMQALELSRPPGVVQSSIQEPPPPFLKPIIYAMSYYLTRIFSLAGNNLNLVEFSPICRWRLQSGTFVC